MGGGAAMRVAAVAAAAVAVLAGVASATVYQVGDKTGWTIMGNPDYAAWASGKNFHLLDVVVFSYNKQFHNVMAVSKADYKNCDTSKPMATWSTGNDSVVLNTTGHHYFICGFTGHCAGGQKVDIRVAAAASAAPSPAPTPEPSSGGGSGGATAAPSPHPNASPKALLAGRSVAATVAASLLSLAAAVLA